MKPYLYIFSILFLTLFVSCKDEDSALEKEISQIPVELKTIRFDSLFFNTSANHLDKLKSDFPYMFPQNVADSVWIQKQNDTLQRELYQEIQKAFPTVQKENSELKKLFQHIKYYFPKFESPKVIYLTSDVDYRSRVIYSDSLLLVGLDNYLGKDHRFYQNIQEYIRYDFEKEDIPVDVAWQISEFILPNQMLNTFLDALIQEGKQQYLVELFLPKTPSYLRLKYPKEKYDWTVANESEIWRYFIENELLYSTDKKLLTRFIYTAPFSKFYLELDNESPGGVGRFIGLQIVQAYMQNNDVSLSQMLGTSSTEIFTKSKYKPAK